MLLFEAGIGQAMIFTLSNFAQPSRLVTSPVSSASWVVDVMSSTLQDTFLSVLKDVPSLVKKTLPRAELWLMVGTQTWQPDTRIARYYKLWGAMRMQGFKVPSDARTGKEIMIESDDGLKFFGTFKFSDSTFEEVAAILLRNNCA